MDVIKRIGQLCEKRGMSYYALMKEAGLAPNAIYLWQRRSAMPSLTSLASVCEALDVTLAQFFQEDGELPDEQGQLFMKWNRLTFREQETIMAVIDTYLELKSRKISSRKGKKGE